MAKPINEYVSTKNLEEYEPYFHLVYDQSPEGGCRCSLLKTVRVPRHSKLVKGIIKDIEIKHSSSELKRKEYEFEEGLTFRNNKLVMDVVAKEYLICCLLIIESDGTRLGNLFLKCGDVVCVEKEDIDQVNWKGKRFIKMLLKKGLIEVRRGEKVLWKKNNSSVSPPKRKENISHTLNITTTWFSKKWVTSLKK